MRDKIHFRRLFFAGLILSILSGCSDKSVVDELDGDLRMRFGVANLQSRASLSRASLQDEGAAFKVWGVYYKSNTGSGSASLIFDGTTVTKKGTAWSYEDPKYWTPGFAYDFRAIYPASTAHVALESPNGRDKSYLTVTGFDATSGVDLLSATPAHAVCNSKEDAMGAVQLTFRHLLSRVVFVGRSDETHLGKERHIVIDEAKLYGIHTAGNWSGSGFTADALVPGSWTTSGSAVGSNNTPYLINQTTYPQGLTLQPGGTHLFTNELFIPQDLSDCVLEIKFHYNVGEPKHFTRTVRLSGVSPKWEAGKSYRYPFTISEHIFFETPQLVPWEYAPVNGSDFNVDHLPN